MGVIASQITSLTTQRFIRAQIKENMKAPRDRPLCGGIHRGPVMASNAEMFPFDDVIMSTIYWAL